MKMTECLDVILIISETDLMRRVPFLQISSIIFNTCLVHSIFFITNCLIAVVCCNGDTYVILKIVRTILLL